MTDAAVPRETVPTGFEWQDLRLGGTVLQKRVDRGDGKYLWSGGLGDHRQVDLLYSDLSLHYGDAPSPVVVCEGAKAAAAVIAAGIPAVGIVSASTMPSDHVLGHLAQRVIILWPDNDDPGRTIMGKLGQALERAGVPELRIVHWDDAPEHGDAADLPPDRIRELVDEASWAGPIDWPELPAAAAGGDDAAADDRPRPQPRSQVDPTLALADTWLIDGLVRPGRLFVVGGPEGLGKTQAIREMAIRIATGHGALFNHYRIPEPRRVLTFDVENGDEEEARREEEILARFGLQRAALADYWGVSLEGLSLNDAGDQAYIRSAIEQAGPALVIFDTASSMIGDEWGAELKSAIRFVRALAREYGCAIVLVVHLVKPAKAGGGSRAKGKPEPNVQHGTALADVMGQWTRAADTVALMASAGAERILWTVRKRAPHSQLVLKAEGGTFEAVQVVAGEDLGVSTAERVHGCIATGQADAASIATYLDIAERTVWRHVAQLRKAGRVASDAPLRVSGGMSVGVTNGVSRRPRTNGHAATVDVSDVSVGRPDTVSPPVGGDMVSVSVDPASARRADGELLQ